MTEDPPSPRPSGTGALAPRSGRTIAANFAWLTGERALDMAITLAVTVLVARHLGPERFGILGYFIGITALFASVVPLGMDRIIALELVREPRNTNRLLGTSTALKLGSGLAAGTAMILIVPALSPDLEQALLFASLFAATLIAGAIDGPELLFSARTQSRYTVLSSAIVRVAMALARLILIYLGAALAAFVAATTLESMLIILVLMLIFRLQGGDLRDWRFDRALAGGLARRGLPLLLASLGTAVLMRAGVVIVEHLSGAAAAGLYATAVRISDTCVLVATNLIVSIGPTLISIRSQSMQRYMDAIARLMQGVSIAMTLVALILCLSSDQLIGILLGPSFADAAGVLRIYVWSTVFIALGMVQAQWLINEGYEKFVLYRAIAGAAINLAANYALIPRYGPEGAAFAAVIAQFSSCVLLNLVYDARTRELFVMQMKALLWLNLGRLLSKAQASADS